MTSQRIGSCLAWALWFTGLAGCQRTTDHSTDHADRHLSIYNWSDYIGTTTIADFEKETGIKVDYDTFDADSTLEAKMLTGASGYDLVSTSENFFSRQIKAGAYRPIDRTQLILWNNIDPAVLKQLAVYDPGNQYAVPYLHSYNGFAYNVDMIKKRMPNAPLDSLDMLFKPEVASRFADCGITFLDSPDNVVQLALVYLHLDPNSDRPEDFKSAEQLLMKVRPFIRNFDSVEFMNGLANRELCLSMGWSSDFGIASKRARDAGIHVNLAFTIPKEGTSNTINGFLIPIDAPHPKEAHEFLNYLLRPEVIAKVTNDTRYPNENPASRAFLNPDILNDPVLYPPPSALIHAFVPGEINVNSERLRTRLWIRIKTAL